MSFKKNDSNDNPMIHLGNYEEYFILYIDQELTDEQMKLVDEFLVHHPDLQTEFEMLAGLRLPMEDLEMDKTGLMAQNMMVNIVDEELLLYVDNELPSEQKKVVELELKNNKEYQLQHSLLLAAKLHASEKVVYPNKKELYRKEEQRVVLFAPWMRVAAAVLIIFTGGLLYFNNASKTAADDNLVHTTPDKPVQTADPNVPDTINATPIDKVEIDQIAAAPPVNNKKHKKQGVIKTEDKVKTDQDQAELPQDVAIAYNEPLRPITRTGVITNKTIKDPASNINVTSSVILNNRSVTSETVHRKIDTTEQNKDVASNKGSVKGFLRKTTRLIEKRTGIDATNDGELLIGAVAINLK